MQDLSHLAEGSLTMDSSMHVGNTISRVPPFGAPGSPSEATDGIAVHDRPEPELGAFSDSHLATKTDAGEGAFQLTPRTWRKVH